MVSALHKKYIPWTMALWLLITACKAQSGDFKEEKQMAGKNIQQIVKNSSQSSYEGPTEYFTGKVRVTPAFAENATTESATGAFVTFEPGARSHWHVHPKGQILVVTDGVGYTQYEGGAIEEIGVGDVVMCPPNVKHWHGASPDSYMTHFVITGVEKGQNVQWMEPVSDEQYFQN